jgi:hypothetical protein
MIIYGRPDQADVARAVGGLALIFSTHFGLSAVRTSNAGVVPPGAAAAKAAFRR